MASKVQPRIEAPCPHCPRVLTTRQGLRRHLRDVHGVVDTTRICTVCEQTKDESRFGVIGRDRSGRVKYRSICEDCKATEAQERRERLSQRPESHKRRDRKKGIARTFGLTVVEYEAAWNSFWKAQDGLCAVCRAVEPDCMDHCHQTGRLRGLLQCGRWFFARRPRSRDQPGRLSTEGWAVAIWIFTPRGFFSAVQKPEDVADDMLTIRARAKIDLEKLADLLPDAEPYQQDGYSDYPWRIRVSKDDWSDAVATMAHEVTYSNFKDEVKHVQGQHRASVYGRIWSVLLDLEERGWKRGSRRGSYGTNTTGWKSGGTGGHLFNDLPDIDDLIG